MVFLAIWATIVVACGASSLSAQVRSASDVPPVVVFRSTDPQPAIIETVETWRPVEVAPATTIVAPPVYSPIVTTYSPVVETVRTDVSYVAPAVSVPATIDPIPVTSYYWPAPAVPVVAPITTYRPVPTVTWQVPAVAPVATVPVAPGAIAVGPPVIVRSRVYVPGQPIRNMFRAITP
jgi:hypothetical protein